MTDRIQPGDRIVFLLYGSEAIGAVIRCDGDIYIDLGAGELRVKAEDVRGIIERGEENANIY